MIRAIAWIIKLGVFSVAVLILGNRLGWGGKTVSDHLNTQIAHAERSETYGKVRGVTSELIEDAKEGIRGQVPPLQQQKHPQLQQQKTDSSSTPKKLRSEEKTDDESIHSSERQKLRALIRELNYTRN